MCLEEDIGIHDVRNRARTEFFRILFHFDSLLRLASGCLKGAFFGQGNRPGPAGLCGAA
jgi:hypothetical protein